MKTIEEIGDVIRAIENGLRERNRLGTTQSEADFIVGALAALQAVYGDPERPNVMFAGAPAAWILNVMSGRDVVDVPCTYKDWASRLVEVLAAVEIRGDVINGRERHTSDLDVLDGLVAEARSCTGVLPKGHEDVVDPA